MKNRLSFVLLILVELYKKYTLVYAHENFSDNKLFSSYILKFLQRFHASNLYELSKNNIFQ